MKDKKFIGSKIASMNKLFFLCTLSLMVVSVILIVRDFYKGSDIILNNDHYNKNVRIETLEVNDSLPQMDKLDIENKNLNHTKSETDNENNLFLPKNNNEIEVVEEEIKVNSVNAIDEDINVNYKYLEYKKIKLSKIDNSVISIIINRKEPYSRRVSNLDLIDKNLNDDEVDEILKYLVKPISHNDTNSNKDIPSLKTDYYKKVDQVESKQTLNEKENEIANFDKLDKPNISDEIKIIQDDLFENSIKNDLLEKIIEIHPPLENLGEIMVSIVHDISHGPVWRDYVIQHYSTYLEKIYTNNMERYYSIQIDALKSSYQKIMNSESSFSATGLIGVNYLYELGIIYDKDYVVEYGENIINNSKVGDAAKATATSILNKYSSPINFLESINVIQNYKTYSLPRVISSITNLGHGGTNELNHLEDLLKKNNLNKYLIPAINNSINKIKSYHE